MKKIFVAGTFDLFHIGHQWLLWNAIKEGSEMMVVVARDQTVHALKKRFPVWNEQARLERIRRENLPHTTFRLGVLTGDFLLTLQQYAPDIIVCGYDQHVPAEIITYCRKNKIEIKRLDPYFPEFFKSSKFR